MAGTKSWASMKVPELKAELSARGLPISGNKADLIGRLQRDDKKASDATIQDTEPAAAAAATAAAEPTPKPAQSAPPGPAAAGSDELKPETAAANPAAQDTGTRPAEPPSERGTVSEAAAAGPAPAPTECSVGSVKDDDTKTDDKAEPAMADHASSGAAAVAPAAPSSATGASSAKQEAMRRAERALRFGLATDSEEIKSALRAQKFGLDESTLVSGLDSALSERPAKRGRRDGGPASSAAAAARSSILDDPAERAKAEARAIRFATGRSAGGT